jgi:predicted transposase YbfD/YdcC
MLFREMFADVPDPRDGNARHDLTEILFIAVVATLCGARCCTGMAQFARARQDLLRSLIPLAAGPPSHDTFSRVLRLIDPKAFDAAFRRFMAAFGAQARLEAPTGVVAVDGKSLRRAYDSGRAHMPPLVVSVFASRTFVTLAQQVAAKGGEAKAAVEALRLLSLSGCTVTADALHCNRAMSEAVRAARADYALTIKGNQSTLARAASLALERSAADPRTPVVERQTSGHGRLETRTAWVAPIAPPNGPKALVGLVAVGRIETTRSLGSKTTSKVRDFALSRTMTPDALLDTVQSHWSIENNLHWQLDVLFREDQARNRKDHGPANLAIVRRLALNILRAHPENIPLSHKQNRAMWQEQFIFELLTHMR